MAPADTALSHSRPASHARRGFSLIEAAIVLGVIGFVIGGIWVAAGAVMDRFKMSALMQGLVLTVKNT